MRAIENHNLYCYSMVASRINVGADKAIALGGNEIIHNWSPNNIKRLVISAEGFIVQYHVLAKNPRLVDVVLFRNQSRLIECFSSPKYKPMVQALTGSRICSSIEEIVYLTKGNQWGMNLPASELDIKSLIIGGRTSGSLLEEVGKRFVRLHSLTILNMGIEEFYKTYKDKLKDDFFQVADEPNLNGTVSIVHKDWWNSTFLRGAHYSLDLAGGKLDNLFTKLKESKSKSEKESKLKAINDRKFGALLKDLDKANTTFNLLRNSVCGLANMVRSENLYFNAPKEHLGTIQQRIVDEMRKCHFKLYALSSIDMDSRCFLENRGMTIEAEPTDDSEMKSAIIESTKALNLVSVAFYRLLVKFTLETVLAFAEAFPIFTKMKLDGVDRVIAVPKDMQDLANQVSEYFGGDLTGTQQTSSIGNCLHICTLLCVSEFAFKNKPKYTKDYWLSKVGGEV